MANANRIHIFCRLIALPLLALSMGFLGAADAAITQVNFRTPETIATYTSNHPVVAAGKNGHIVAAWSQQNPKGVVIVTSELRMGSWTTPEKIPGSEGGDYPSIAVGAGGDVVVGWVASGRIGVSIRKEGDRFSKASTLGSGSQNSDPTVSIGATGRAVAVWTSTGTTRSVESAFADNYKWGTASRLDGGTDTSSASKPSVAMDSAGRAVVLYTQGTPPAFTANTVQQAIAGSSGGFGTPVTLEAKAFSENGVDSSPRVVSNTTGQVAASWGSNCTDGCPQAKFFKMGVGTTTTGVATTKAVSNPYAAESADTGPERKAAAFSDVAIDESGNGTMVWEVTRTGIDPPIEIWAANATSLAAFSASTKIGTNTDAVASDLDVTAADGRVIATWASAPSAGASSGIQMVQSAFAGTSPSTWTSATMVSAADESAVAADASISHDGTAAIVYSGASNDTKATTNARRDTAKPTLNITESGRRFSVIKGRFFVRVSCPITEARCGGKAILKRKGSGKTFGRVTYQIDGGEQELVTFKLNAAGKRAIARKEFTAVTATFTTTDLAMNYRIQKRSWILRKTS